MKSEQDLLLESVGAFGLGLNALLSDLNARLTKLERWVSEHDLEEEHEASLAGEVFGEEDKEAEEEYTGDHIVRECYHNADETCEVCREDIAQRQAKKD